MPHRLSLPIAGLFALLAACHAPASYDVQTPCVADEECPDGYCEHGFCAAGEAPDVADVTIPDERDTDDREPDLSGLDTANDDTDDERPDTGDAPSGGEVGALCTDDADCLSGRCLWTSGDRTCVSPCDEGCPEGTVCAVARGDRGEPLRSCVHLSYIDCEDADLDGFGVGDMCLGEDCDDANPAAHPEHEEVCDDVDNDCDGELDEEVTYVNGCGGCRLLDGEPGGACGTCDTGTLVCDGLEALTCEGEVTDAGSNACGGCAILELEPGAPCGACGDGTVACVDPETVVCQGSRPAPPEVCDGMDNDCDGEVDEDNPEGGMACDTGELGGCAEGAITCVDAALICTSLRPSEAERCDGIDNDCDGLTDEEVLGTYFQDSDGDGAGNPNVVLRACSAPPGYVLDGTDCNDARNDIVSGACTPGETRSSACGNCGTQTETCSLTCQWAVTTGCMDQGECAPGAIDRTGCGVCAGTVCNTECTWGDLPPTGGVVSSGGGDGTCEACLCDDYETCDRTCPAGTHTSRYVSASCGTARECSSNCGYEFDQCDEVCPVGYYLYATANDGTQCYGGGWTNVYTCRLILPDDDYISPCDACPGSWTDIGGGSAARCSSPDDGYYRRCRR